MNTKKINFPEKFHINNCPVYAKNEIIIKASAEDVWKWLINVITWPEWYPNSSNINVINQGEQVLKADTEFKWRTFNTNIKSSVKRFEPYEQLAWEAKGLGLNAYHGWLIIPNNEGVHVITEEVQYGILPSLGRGFIKKGLLKQHQIWLEGLKRMSERRQV